MKKTHYSPVQDLRPYPYRKSKTKKVLSYFKKHWIISLTIITILFVYITGNIGTPIKELPEEKINYDKIFHDTGIELYDQGLLARHYEACAKVAQSKSDKELAMNCLEKSKLLGVFDRSYEPIELFYTYPIDAGTEISQTPREHYANNGIWATDVSTHGVAMSMYAPDIRNEKREYVVSYVEDYQEDYGTALMLTSNMERFVIGHIDGAVSGSVTTGEFIGTTNMQGVSTGYHAHIEYHTGIQATSSIIWTQAEYKVDPNYNIHEVFKLNREKNKKLADEDYWYISSYYTPVEGQASYYNGSYERDYSVNCHGNCLSPADGGKLLTQKDKYQVVACPSEYKLGTKFNITLPDDHPEYPNKSWNVTCRDRGGAVRSSDTNKKGQNQLDLWSGIGEVGHPHPWIGEMSTRKAKVELLNN